VISGPALQNIINQARCEIEPHNALRNIFAYEKEMLRRLVLAIDTETDAELIVTVSRIKADLDTLRCSVLTVLPALVNMLAEELRRQACDPGCKAVA
jgi:hypothetical protein